MRARPRVAVLRGHLLSPYEAPPLERLVRRFDLTAFTPHETRFDLSSLSLPRETLFCPLLGGTPFAGRMREFQALRDKVQGRTHSFCGLADRLDGFDLYHTIDTYYCFSYEAVVAKRRTRAALVVTQWENIPHLNEHKWLFRHVKRRVREEADLFVAATEDARRALHEEGVEDSRIHVVYPGVDVRRFAPGPRDPAFRRRYGIPEAAPLVLFVGRLVEGKGVAVLRAAIPRLLERIPDLRFLLLGKDEIGMDAWCARRDWGGRVVLGGHLSYGELPAAYRAADAFVLPSVATRGWREQFGYVLAEALASGLPVVAAASGAIPEVVGDAGLLVPPGEPEALADGLETALRRGPAAFRRKARERAVRLFSVESCAKGLEAAYQRALRGRRTA